MSIVAAHRGAESSAHGSQGGATRSAMLPTAPPVAAETPYEHVDTTLAATAPPLPPTEHVAAFEVRGRGKGRAERLRD